MTNHKKGTQYGFTIVELLIVIVVIGILAAITIVAYNGIQNRSRLAAYQSDVTNIDKKTESYSSINGSYPLTAQGLDTLPTTCTTSGTTSSNLLKNALAAQNETALPATIQICASLVTAAVPTNAQATTAVTTGTTVNYYYVKYCATGKGMYIYYPDPTAPTADPAKSVSVGVCP
jgi:prepilin-type N-terminal cleavage/methylation domain-containing protein